MRRLVLDGVPPGEAARIAADQAPAWPVTDGGPPPGPSGRLAAVEPEEAPETHPAADAPGLSHRAGRGAGGPPTGAPAAAPRASRAEMGAARVAGGGRAGPGPIAPTAAGGPGGRVLALPGAAREVRGLARAAMALDARSLRRAMERAVQEQGVVATWDGVLRPVLVAVGQRWAATGEGVEVEHLLAETAIGVLRRSVDAPEPRNGRPVLLACAPGEMHSLPLSALAAALSERGVGVRLLGGGLPAPALFAAVRRTGPAVLLVWAQMARYADVSVLDGLPVLRPPVAVLAGGSGWNARTLPSRVTHVPDLTAAVTLICRAVGGG